MSAAMVHCCIWAATFAVWSSVSIPWGFRRDASIHMMASWVFNSYLAWTLMNIGVEAAYFSDIVPVCFVDVI